MVTKMEKSNLRHDAERAVELAEAGDVRGGCARLIHGLVRAKRLQRAGFGAADGMVAQYETAVAQYAARYRSVQPQRRPVAGLTPPAPGRWVN